MKKMLKMMALLLVIATVVFAAGCAEQGEEEAEEGEVAEESAPVEEGASVEESAPAGEMPTYIVGTEAQFPPYEIVENGEIIGLDIDIMNAIAEDQGFNVQYIDQDFAGLIPALQTGNIDIIASGMTITEDRSKEVSFSNPYVLDAGLAIAVLEGNNEIQGVEGLKGKVVAVQTGSTGYDKAEKLQKEGIIADIKDFPHVNEAISELEIGGADAFINDLPVTQAFMNARPGVIKIVGEPLNSESYGFAVRKDNTEILQKINTGLKNIQENGKYDEIMNNSVNYV